MSTALIWIVLPGLLAVVLWFLRERRILTLSLGGGVSMALALAAWSVPLGGLVKFGPLSFEILSSLVIFGRRFTLDSGDRMLLFLVYGFGAVWFLGSTVAGAKRSFIPLGLGVMALLVAAIAVEPFLYAALLIETAVLITVPMLAETGKPISQGILRYLIFQTLAMPFILLAGWVLGQLQANPSDAALMTRAAVLLGLGFAFWLAVFPFYTWMPLLTERTNPYVAGFVLILLPVAVLILGLNFLDGFPILLEYAGLFQALRLTGALMVVTGGLWAAFQNDLGRLFGYAVIVETGFSLLAISLGSKAGLEVFAVSLLPRMASLGVMGLTLSILQQYLPDLQLDHTRGLLRRFPYVCTAFVLAYFSIVGLPLLAGFPVRRALLGELAVVSLPFALWVLAGNISLLFGGLRVLNSFARSSEAWRVGESRMQVFMLVMGTWVILMMGLFPGWVLAEMRQVVSVFEKFK